MTRRRAGGLVATLRIARRDAWRHKARSVLIITMVAVPVLGLSAADVLARTMQLNAPERLTREIGQADVALQGTGGGHVQQGVDPADGYTHHGHSLAAGSPAAVALRTRALALIGASPGVTTVRSTIAPVSANGFRLVVELDRVDVGSPLTAGITTLERGRAPSGPDQVAVSPRLADLLGVSIGGQVTVSGAQRTVTAVVRDPQELNGNIVYAAPEGLNGPHQPLLLATTSRPVTWPEVQQLNALGFVVTSREVVEHPPPGVPSYSGPNYTVTKDRVGVATVAVGLAVLEVVLLAGAAFAVGARRQRRDLALVAAAGGDARHVRQIVLAGGLVLGIAGGLIGTAAGIGVGRLALGVVARQVNRTPGHFDLRPLELLAVLLIGVVTGVIASVLPARAAANDDVVSALTGRRGVTSTVRRVPALGLLMIAAGIVIAAEAARTFHFRWILTGAVLSELGFVVCAPTVVALAGRLAQRLPLAPRLALRDASRHRGRSGPAVAAIMAAIAGSIAVSSYFVSTEHRDRADYLPSARIGQPVLDAGDDASNTARQAAAAVAVVRRDLQPSRIVAVPTVRCIEETGHCDSIYATGVTGTSSGAIAIGDAALLRSLTGSVDSGAERALAAGQAVFFSTEQPQLLREGRNRSGDRPIKGLGSYLDDVGSRGAAVAGIVSPATAASLHLRQSTGTYIVLTAATPSAAQVDRIDDQLPLKTALIVDRGYQAGGYSIGLVVLALAAALVTLAATAVSVGLSMAESKPDLITLSAVGGRPRTRRLLVANQAGTVALLGALLGVVAGVIPAWAILRADHGVPFVLPWATILVTVVGVPLLAMVGTAVFAGSRLTLDRRLS